MAKLFMAVKTGQDVSLLVGQNPRLMVKLVDNFLNKITIYRLVLYILLFFVGIAIVLSALGFLPFKPLNLFLSSLFLVLVCWITNRIFAKIFKAPVNLESFLITSLILALIITPINSPQQLPLLALVGVLAIVSKFIIAINKKHIFNPTAFAVVLSAIALKFGASWWIGNSYMLIPVLIGGLLVVKKVRRFSMVLAFITIYVWLVGPQITQSILDSPIFFFSFIMLIEPQTQPTTKNLQILYGALVGIGSFYQTPEIALLIGNIFSYIVSPKEKLLLKLKEKIKTGTDTYDYIFALNKKMNYLPGQYMEWTLSHNNPDSRGNRRYFTLAASPSENTLRIGVKFYPNGSSFKARLADFNKGDQIVASQLSGEFTLPKDPSQKLVFIAGGIGITPFRSMIKYLLDYKEKRDIFLFYSLNAGQDIVYKRSLKGNFQDELSRFPYKGVFDEANKLLGIKTFYVNTDKMGYIDEKMIREKVPDFKERVFYISGPHSMVDAFEKTLKNLGVKNIKVDFFPGYA